MILFILYFVLVVVVVIIFFILLLNYIVYKAFHYSHVKEKKRPDLQKFNFREILIPTERKKKIQIYDLNPTANFRLAVVAIHGWGNNSHIFYPIAEALVQISRVFLVNARNHGKSDSDDTMTIVKYEADLRHAVDYVFQVMGKQTTVVVMGHSLGAAASILSAADDARIAGVVAISSFADLRQIMYQGFLQRKIPNWLANSVIKYIEFRVGRSLKEISPQKSIRRFNKPVLLVHGTKDELVPFGDMDLIRKMAGRNNVETLAAEGQSHASLLKNQQVVQMIKVFIEKYFIKGDL